MQVTILSEELPVGEKFTIRKNVIRNGDSSKRLCVVSGTHGDELEGQFVCFELARRLNSELNLLDGVVEIYPALNPLGIDSITRGFPGFDLDMNRVFPGNPVGHLVEYAASRIIEDLRGAEVVIDIHASNIFLREIMQARINAQTASALVPLAKLLNIDFIWVHDSATVLQTTLAHSLNALATKTLVVEMGIGMRLTLSYGARLVDGILNLLRHLKMWRGAITSPISKPILSIDGDVVFMNAEKSGIIIPTAQHSDTVKRGDLLCQIVDPFAGEILQDVTSPVDGLVFTLRAYPVVYQGSLIARIYKNKTTV